MKASKPFFIIIIIILTIHESNRITGSFQFLAIILPRTLRPFWCTLNAFLSSLTISSIIYVLFSCFFLLLDVTETSSISSVVHVYYFITHFLLSALSFLSLDSTRWLIPFSEGLYHFSTAAVTNYHKLSDLKQHRRLALTSGGGAGPRPLHTPGRTSRWRRPALLGSGAFPRASPPSASAPWPLLWPPASSLTPHAAVMTWCLPTRPSRVIATRHWSSAQALSPCKETCAQAPERRTWTLPWDPVLSITRTSSSLVC